VVATQYLTTLRGRYGNYDVYWDPFNGYVEVGLELVTDDDGDPIVAYSEARAIEVALYWIRQWG
jgi:hypothetical protein